MAGARVPDRAGFPGEFIAFHVYGSGCTMRDRTVTLARMPTMGSSIEMLPSS
jgi:hypothetical protein